MSVRKHRKIGGRYHWSNCLLFDYEFLLRWMTAGYSSLTLYPLSDACREEYISHIQKGVVRFGMTVSCGEDKPVYTFELTLSPTEKDREGGARA